MELQMVLTVIVFCCCGAYGDISKIPDTPTKEIGGFTLPCMLMADKEGKRVYVSDRGQSLVKVLSRKGVLKSTIDQGFNQPGGIAMSDKGLLYIADLANHRIVITTKDGQLQGAIGNSNSTLLNYPMGVAIGPDGLLYITEWSNQQVQVLTMDGRPVKGIPLESHPMGITFGNDGCMHVALPPASKIVVFDTNGHQIKSVDAHYPIQIDIDLNGYIYVAHGDSDPAPVKIYDEDYNLQKTLRDFPIWMGCGVARLGKKVYATGWDGGKLYIY